MLDARLDRRTMLLSLGYAVAGLTVASCSRGPIDDVNATNSTMQIPFDPQAFSEKTTTVATAAGDKQVTYKFYGPITYVANPVDADYQSLVISVPTEIDGKQVDSADAPIVFANSVGGYMPASVKDAAGVGDTGISGTPPTSEPPSTSSSGGVASGGNAMLDADGERVSLAKLAVAAGYVVVEPGCRGRTLKNAQGLYHGTAPAAIVDLKAAIRFLRAHSDAIPGNTDRIVSTGTSAGGALSALLGASGDSPLYEPFLAELGAADASDSIFASGDWCPITDLEHADAAYEWNWGTNPVQSGGQVDQRISAALQQQFVEYMDSLGLEGRNGFGPLTAANYEEYLLESYLQPAATDYLTRLPDRDRNTYLGNNAFIQWSGGRATFTWADFLSHVGERRKTEPAFDAFDLSTGENNLFGAGTTERRHFTAYSAANDTLAPTTLAADITDQITLMNPMHQLEQGDTTIAPHWWIRLGTKDTDTSLTVSANLAAKVAASGADVNHIMYWDEGHGANTDAADFIAWVAQITT